MGRPVSNEDGIRAVEIEQNKRWQKLSNPIHSTTVGKLYPFDKKDPASKYTYPMLLKHQRAKSAPTKNALGADISLLQGPIPIVSGSGMHGSGKPSKAMMKLKKVAIDEKNDMYEPTEMGTNGYIPEDEENQFKLPDLKPKKKK
jgi:hypothetical protein